jgi:Zn-dependent protease
LPFKCPYCGLYFCAEHRLPENHHCEEIDKARTSRDEQPLRSERQKPIGYGNVYPFFRIGARRFAFSRKEIMHLAIAAVLVIGVGFSFPNMNYSNYQMLALLSVLFALSFLIHELAHKLLAQKYGLWAEFRLTLMGAILTSLSLIPSFIKIIGPGAVVVNGQAEEKTIGMISVIGPTINITLASALCGAAVLVPSWIFEVVAFYNVWISVFNLIPIGVLDGYKVFNWNKAIWSLAFAASVVLGIFIYWFFWFT